MTKAELEEIRERHERDARTTFHDLPPKGFVMGLLEDRHRLLAEVDRLRALLGVSDGE